MRISDWISDVCSSDLKELRSLLVVGGRAGAKEQHQADGDESLHVRAPESGLTMLLAPSCAAPRIFPGRQWVKSGRTSYTAQLGVGVSRGARRSEEHTSELQSLMRISYAVFCLE